MSPFAHSTILTIENNLPMRRMVTAVLSAFGAGRVIEAGDALTGYLLACSETVDLVLLDFFLGERDGAAFTRLLRCDIACPNRAVPVIVLTALPYHPRVKAAIAAGANGILGKPIVPRDLYATLAGTLAHEPEIAAAPLPIHAAGRPAPERRPG